MFAQPGCQHRQHSSTNGLVRQHEQNATKDEKMTEKQESDIYPPESIIARSSWCRPTLVPTIATCLYVLGLDEFIVQVVLSEASQKQTNHGYFDQSFAGLHLAFIVNDQQSAAKQPSECPLHNPALWGHGSSHAYPACA
jgi:hypothetical protein